MVEMYEVGGKEYGMYSDCDFPVTMGDDRKGRRSRRVRCSIPLVPSIQVSRSPRTINSPKLARYFLFSLWKNEALPTDVLYLET